MLDFINYIIAEIEAGAGASTLLVELRMLQKLAERLPDFQIRDIVRVLGGENNAE